MAKRRKRVEGKAAATLSESHTHSHTHTSSLTLQGVFHVLSEQRPHDLGADFTHVEFLRKPAVAEVVRDQDESEY